MRAHHPESATKIMTAALPATHLDRLRELAREHDRSLSAEVRRAVRSHLRRSAVELSSSPPTGPPPVGGDEFSRAEEES